MAIFWRAPKEIATISVGAYNSFTRRKGATTRTRNKTSTTLSRTISRAACKKPEKRGNLGRMGGRDWCKTTQSLARWNCQNTATEISFKTACALFFYHTTHVGGSAPWMRIESSGRAVYTSHQCWQHTMASQSQHGHSSQMHCGQSRQCFATLHQTNW